MSDKCTKCKIEVPDYDARAIIEDQLYCLSCGYDDAVENMKVIAEDRDELHKQYERIRLEKNELIAFIDYLFDSKMVLGHDRDDHWEDFQKAEQGERSK